MLTTKKMFVMRIVICVCLVAFISSEDVPNNSTETTVTDNDDTTLQDDLTSDSNTEKTVTDNDDTTLQDDLTSNSNTDTSDDNSSDTNTSDYSTEESHNTTTVKSTIDHNQDIVITGTATPDDDGADGTTEDSNSTTGFEDFHNTTSVETTVTEEIKSSCLPNPCRNGGTCTEDAEIPSLFYCACVEGYVGIRCGTLDKCITDEDGKICKNGACVYSEDGLTRSCKCFAHTYWDDDRKECRDSEPPCFPNPCLNGGTCKSYDDKVDCLCPTGYITGNCSVLDKCGDCKTGKCVLDEKNMIRYCKCSEGLYWDEDDQECKDLESPCDSNPCLNGGICHAVTDEDYNCTCTRGFSGQTCEITDKCSIDEDCEHGTCVLASDNTQRICHCHNGFYLEEYSHTCKEITNICAPNPCLNDGICTVISGTKYNCTCSFGYTGENCETRDMCEMDGGNVYCGNGKCSNNLELGVYYCTCEEEEYFQYSERKCAELDMCPLVHCNSVEKCQMGKCICKDNYRWNNVTQKCEPDYCSSNPCPLSEMICEEGTGSADYKCTCQDGYAFNGTHCNEAICIFPTLNSCNQYCSVEEDGYKCSCTEGFEIKEDNHTCLYTGNNTCTNKTCGGKGVCIQREDEEKCLCSLGFTEINGTCMDVCSAGQLTSGVCPSDSCEVTAEGDFRCKCEGKLTLSRDKTTCMVRNVCKENEIGWMTCMGRNAKCVVDWMATEGFTCLCSTGHVPTEGELCRDICSLESKQRLCSIRGATCDVDEKGKMFCRCPPYFKQNEGDGKCTQPADFSYLVTLPLDKSTYLRSNRKQRSLDTLFNLRKISADVTVTMKEMFLDFTQANIISCRVAADYISCKIELQFATEQEEAIKLLETEDTCLSNDKSDQCLLPPLLILVKNKIKTVVQIQPTNPCDDDIKNFVCGSETTCNSTLKDKSFNCSCNPGYFARSKIFQFGNLNSFIEMCSDINECEEANPCPQNSKCINTMGSYECSCKPGFRSIKDTSSAIGKCVEICYPNPCMHGKCFRKGKNEFDCRCEAGYSGALCNLKDENFKRAKINTIIVGVVLGGALLVTIILFAACISRLRKKKSLESAGQLYYNTEMTERRRAEGGAINNAYQRE